MPFISGFLSEKIISVGLVCAGDQWVLRHHRREGERLRWKIKGNSCFSIGCLTGPSSITWHAVRSIFYLRHLGVDAVLTVLVEGRGEGAVERCLVGLVELVEYGQKEEEEEDSETAGDSDEDVGEVFWLLVVDIGGE